MDENCHSKLRNNFIYYALNTDSNQTEEKSYEKDFNLKIMKEKIDEFKKQRIKFYEEYVKCKIKKIKKTNKPTPYQIFLKEKEYLKSMNDYKIKHNLNPLGTKISIISKKNKTQNDNANIKNNKSKKNILLGQLSPILYLNKVKNYKKKNMLFDRLKTDLYHYFMDKPDFKKIHKNNNSEKSLKKIQSNKSNNEKQNNFFQCSIKNLTSRNMLIKRKLSHLFISSSSHTNKKSNKEKYTNTVCSLINKQNYKKDVSFSNRNNNKLHQYYTEYNKTENISDKNDIDSYIDNYLNNLFKNKMYNNKYNSQQFFKKKKDIIFNKKYCNYNEDNKNKKEDKYKNELFITSK